MGRSVDVFFNTSPYRKHDRQHGPSLTMPLTRPTADTRLVIAAALRAVEGVFRPGFNSSRPARCWSIFSRRIASKAN